jgi:hypothetical protein
MMKGKRLLWRKNVCSTFSLFTGSTASEVGKTADLSCITPAWHAKSKRRANGNARISGFGGVLNRLAGRELRLLS